MITLKTLKWDNCFSYGPDNQIDLSDAKLTQIVGLNGSGKSSIPLILEEVLFNKNSKGVKKGDIPNRLLDGSYTISLDFSKDGDEYTIEYTRKNTAKVKLIKNGEDVSSHTATSTYNTIQEIIGIDFKTFSQLVYQSTNTSLQFLTATDTNRKKFLIDLLNLDHYVDLHEKFKQAHKEKNDAVLQTRGELEATASWINSNKGVKTDFVELIEVPALDPSLEANITSLSKELTELSNTASKISKNNEYKRLLKNINLQETKAFLETNQKISIEEHRNELANIDAEIKQLKAILASVGSLESVCHACGQSIDTSERERIFNESSSALAVQENLRIEIVKKITKIKENNTAVENSLKIVKDWEELFRCIDKSLPSEPPSKEKITEELNVAKKLLEATKEEIKNTTIHNNAAIAHNARVKLITEQMTSMQSKLDDLKIKVHYLESELSVLEILKKSFSTNGLVAYKIENLVKDLEDLTNHYLADLSDGRFTLQFVVNNDKLNVDVTDNGTNIDISSLSSGELARVNTSTLIAIRKLMSSIAKTQINVLFLDEVISVLDDIGKERLVEVLLEEDLNTFLVSHNWQHPLLEKVEITKTAGISRLETA
jgi:DNA repair exonuclease SbcCD ATPase subunit